MVYCLARFILPRSLKQCITLFMAQTSGKHLHHCTTRTSVVTTLFVSCFVLVVVLTAYAYFYLQILVIIS